MSTKQQLSPLEEAFECLRKWKTTKSDNVKERMVSKLFYAGYVIRPAMMIIIKDEVHSDVLNEGSKEWTLYSRQTGRPVTPPNATWQMAASCTEVNRWIINRKSRRVLIDGMTDGMGAIKRQENGLYTVSNARREGQGQVIFHDVPAEQVDAKLAELGIENADWR